MKESPESIFGLYQANEITYSEMMHLLRRYKESPGFTKGVHDPTGGDGYVPGTWDVVMDAAARGLLRDADYEELARDDEPIKYTTGVIATARGVLDIVVAQAKRYEDGEINAHAFDLLLDRARRQAQKACWCDEGVCCYTHNKHVMPHERCILR